MNINEILKGTENTTVEFKEKINESIFKTISAFANKDGGIIYIGISDKKEIKGLEYTNSLLGDLTNKIVNMLGIHPQIDCIKINKKDVLQIKVKKSTLPVSYKGKYYTRVGNTTREMQGEELRSFFIKGTNWDGLTGNYSLDEIDPEAVRKFIRMAVGSGRLRTEDEKEDIKTILKKLKLIINGKLTNGAIMLFGKNPQKYFINALVRVGRFKDEITIIGDRRIEGNLFKQIEEAEEAIKNFINVRYEITGEQLTRKNIWDYPLEAIREALLNAVIHRDYFKYNVQTQIKIFNDWIWFFNIGGLPEGITLEQLKTTHPSVARNPLIVHIFYLAGLIEEYGSGIGRIMDSLKEANLPEPEFKEEFAGFSLYLRKDYYTEERPKETGLNDRQIKAVMYVKENGKITNKEYQELNNIKKRQTSEDLAFLENKGVLEKIGTTGRGTYYILRGIKRAKGALKGH
jgi:ATP-dependent DNA helicase RecG